MEVIKLSEVTLTEETTNNSNVLIEENGEIKRVSKSAIGAQADWNETDETNPSFILNKPEDMTKYVYYAISGLTICKSDGTIPSPLEFPTESNVTQEEFEAAYKERPVMILSTDSGVGATPVVHYYVNSANCGLIVYYSHYSENLVRISPRFI